MDDPSGAEAYRQPLQGQIDTLLRGIILDEGLAREMAGIAHLCRQGGNRETAEGMSAICRHHRIRGMEGRALIAAMKDLHAGILDLT